MGDPETEIAKLLEHDGEPASRNRPIVRIATALLVVAVAVLVAAALVFGWSVDLSGNAIENVIRSWGAWGVLASIGLMVLHSFLPFPAEIIAIANGMVYGPIWGIVITWTGAMLGALLAFGLARTFGRPFVERMLGRKHWQSIDAWATAQGGRMVLLSRLFPAIAFNLINYAAGLSGISWPTFIWATGIGILPLTALMVVMGDRIETLPWWVWLVALVTSAALWYLLRHSFHPPRSSK